MVVGVRYVSAVRGCDDELGVPPEHEYYGFVERVNVSGTAEDRRRALETSVLRVHEYLGPVRLPDGRVVEPVPGKPVERYEVYDYESDDLIVLWRVPVRPVETNEHL